MHYIYIYCFSRTPLHVALMLAFSGGFVSAPIAPGLQIALNLINEDESLLPGYTLHYTFSDSKVCVNITEKIEWPFEQCNYLISSPMHAIPENVQLSADQEDRFT